MDTTIRYLQDEFGSSDDDDDELSALFDTSEQQQQQEEEDSGLTDEHLFASMNNDYASSSNDYQENDSQDVSNVLDEEQSLFSGAWNAVPTTPSMDESLEREVLSPFSPLLQEQERESASNINVSWQQSSANTDFSLLACRKVSVVLNVTLPHIHNNDDKLCLFPLLPKDASASNTEEFASPSATLAQAQTTNALVAVNPTAFGKYIPAQVTLETARLVANVANIESEDWARRFKFDEIQWPYYEGSDTNNNDNDTSVLMTKLATSMANDVLERNMGSVVIGVGATNSGKTKTMFGYKESDNTTTTNYGLLGMTVELVLDKLPEHAVCTLSIMEIVDKGEMRDLLLVNGKSSSSITIRHGKRGAVVHGLSDVPLDSMTGLGHLMRKAFSSNNATSTNNNNDTRGHVICSLKVWQNGVQLNLHNLAKCTTITLADLASGEEGDGTNESRMASFRKSIVTLRGVLRSLLLQQDGLLLSPPTNATALSYRECTLTQVLQRPLNECRTVVLGNVVASAEAYEKTLHTLNYLNRLLIGPGKTARSPFTTLQNSSQQQQGDEVEENVAESPCALFDQYGDNKALLESVVSDPRQRLAKVMPPRTFLATPTKLQLDNDDDDSSDDDGYEPIDYMQIDPRDAMKDERVPMSPLREDFDDARRPMNDLAGEEDDESRDEPLDEVDGDNAPVMTSEHESQGMDDVASPKSWNEKRQVVSGMDAMKFKSMGSPSEESSTQPIDSTSSSGRTGLRLTHSPDDVNEWVASFEEKEDGSNEANGVTSSKGDGAVHAMPSSGSSDSPIQYKADIETQPTETFEAARDGATVDSFESPGKSESPNDFDTPFVARKNAFSTPKADWPDIEDEESELSLASLHNNEASLGDQHLLATAASDQKRSPARPSLVTSSRKPETNAQPAIPSKIETPNLSRTDVNESKVLSPSDQCIGELDVLEGAVDQIKRLHNGLWETSALSLDRLRHSQELQKREIENAITARRDSEMETQRLEQELRRESRERERDAREFGERIAVMESRISSARSDRSDMEKIAEEAISAQDWLEQELARTKEELDRQTASAASAASKYNHEVASSKDLSRQLELTLKSLDEMRSAHSNCKEVIEDLGSTIDELRMENEQLKEERDAFQAMSSDQSRILAEQNRLKLQFEHCQEEISSLQEENATLTSNLRDYQARFEKAGQQQKTLGLQFESENLALQNDIDEWERRCLELEETGEQASQQHAAERLVLVNEMAELKSQLDESQAEVAFLREEDKAAALQRDEEIDNLTSEMRELQLERERERSMLTNVEHKYETLRSDAKEKLKQLVKEKKAATTALERAREENAAHHESNQHLLHRIDQVEHERDSLQQQLSWLLERLEAEEIARQQAEERARQFEWRGTTVSSAAGLDDASTHSSLHLDQYSEAERALLKAIKDEKSDAARWRRRSSSEQEAPMPRRTQGVPAATTTSRTASVTDSAKEQRAMFAQFEQDLQAEYGIERSDGRRVSYDSYRAEQIRRQQAEELAAAMAVRAKDGLEKRNREIMNLKVELASVADEKEAEILRLRSELHSRKRESFS